MHAVELSYTYITSMMSAGYPVYCMQYLSCRIGDRCWRRSCCLFILLLTLLLLLLLILLLIALLLLLSDPYMWHR